MLISLLLLCSSCDSYRARRMEKHAIAFPDSLEFIYQGEAGVRHLDVTSPPAYKLVMVIDSVQCSFCKVQKLQRYRDLFKESIDGGKFDLLVILSPKRGEADDLREFLLAHDFSIPIFLDQDNTFLTLNPFIPSDARFHSFLLDASGHLVFIGDPLKGNQAYKKFERVITQ